MIWLSYLCGNTIMSNRSTARRDFTKFLAFGPLAFLVRKFWPDVTPARAGSMPVAGIDEVAIGGYKLFRYPTEDDPCILLRLAPDEFVAFNQNCTHLSCPVHFNSDKTRLECPCHSGSFSAQNGQPLAGPPQRPLTAISLTIRNGKVWVA